MTYSVDSRAWMIAGKVVFFTGLKYESSHTTSPVIVEHPSWQIVPIIGEQIKVRMEGNDGFQILLNSGEKFSSYKDGIFLVSRRQLDLLQVSGATVTIIGTGDSMRNNLTQEV